MGGLPGRRDRVTQSDRAWPACFDELRDPPETLWVQGTLPPTDAAVTVVGTRRADVEAQRFARDLGGAVVRAGGVIVSGGAFGVDAAAHQGALDGGGVTIAVMGGGLDQLYPAAHRSLFQRIAERGALVSEVADPVTPRPAYFLRRNRLLAALARLVVVVQAPARSGALSTATHARSLGRPVFVVPAAPWDPRGQGCLQLLREGARPCGSIADVLDALGTGRDRTRNDAFDESAPRADGKESESFDPDHRRVLQFLGARPRHLDEIQGQARVSSSRLSEVLFDLELCGAVEARPGGRYVRSVRRSITKRRE